MSWDLTALRVLDIFSDKDHQIEFILNSIFSFRSQCHAFLCMNSWALVTLVTSVQNIDIQSNLVINLQPKLQTRDRRICPTKLGPKMSNLINNPLAININKAVKWKTPLIYAYGICSWQIQAEAAHLLWILTSLY